MLPAEPRLDQTGRAPRRNDAIELARSGDIVARGVSAGPEVARVLRAVEAQWVAEGFPPEARVRELLDRALAS